MRKTIYNVYVVMDSQATCDRMKQLCIENELPYMNNFNPYDYNNFGFFYYWLDVFCNFLEPMAHQIRVTETEFIELLKTTKNA